METLPPSVQRLLAQQDYRKRIDKVTGHIRAHLAEPLSLHVLAELAGFSPFHFYRLFAAFVGETLGEYVRRLRLQRAYQLLLLTRRTVTDIALESGYETPAAFTRAFQQAFHLSPSALRRQGRLAGAAALAASPRNTLWRYPMEPEIRTYPDRTIIFVSSYGMMDRNFNKAARRSFEILSGFLNQQRAWHKVDTCLGICPDGDDVAWEKARYDGAYFLKPGQEIAPQGEIQTAIVPGGRFAVFLHHGIYDTLWQTWNAIYRDWLPGSGYQLRDVQPYEVYVDDPARVPPDKRTTEIHIPIV